MAVNVEVVAEKVFNLLAGNGYDISNLDSKGDKVIDPQDATRFVVVNPNILVRLDKATETLSMGVREDFDDDNLREAFKSLAGDYLMNFDYRIFGKQLKPKSETIDIAQKSEKNMGDVLEAINELRKLSGLSRSDQVEEAINYAEPDPQPEQNVVDEFADVDPKYRSYYIQKWAEKNGMNSDDAMFKAGYVKDGYIGAGAWNWRYVGMGESVNETDQLDEFQQFDPNVLNQAYDLLNKEQTKIYNRQGRTALLKTYSRSGRERLAKVLYKRGLTNDYRSSLALVNMYFDNSDIKSSVEHTGKPIEEYNDRPSLDTDLPSDYFDKLAMVKKSIFSKYGNNDRVEMIISRLNDEEKANGRKADPTNIMMKVSAHLGESAQWEKIEEGFSPMSGSTKTSYQGLDNVKLVIRHKKEVNEEIRGSRSRNISSIFVQRGDERFKMAENNLKAARAMARHVKNGGEPFDAVGSAINEMAVEQRKLREFIRYVKKSGLVNEDNESFVNLAVENINYITSAFTKLAGVKSYATAVEDVTDRRNTEVLQDDIDLESKFTETHFDDKVANVVDFVKSAMSRKTAYESYIDKAVSNESFAQLKNMLSEDDGMEFATPHAKLGYQVSQMSNSVNDPRLGNYLTGISKKLYSGDRMSQHEYTTIKSCLLGAHGTQSAPTSVAESVEDQYEKFIEQFDIL